MMGTVECAGRTKMRTVGCAGRTEMGTVGCAGRTQMGTVRCAGRTKIGTVGCTGRTTMADGDVRREIRQGFGECGWKLGISLRRCKKARGFRRMKSHRIIVWFDVRGLGGG